MTRFGWLVLLAIAGLLLASCVGMAQMCLDAIEPVAP
jgi:hypothetical protein